MQVAAGSHSDETTPPVVAAAGTGFADLLRSLGIALVTEPSASSFLLVDAGGRLELRPPGERESPGIHAHFPPDRPTPGAPAHPLVRAFGKTRMEVFDLTAGLGADAYRLAEAGHRVRACEREPALYALLETGWAEAQRQGRVAPSIAERLRFEHAEADAVVASIEGPNLGVYLDPMYPPPRRASALPRREVQVLRRLLGEAEAPGELLAAARARAARVVVKRPHHAPPVAPGASFVVESKLVRFDVYLDPRRMGTTTT